MRASAVDHFGKQSLRSLVATAYSSCEHRSCKARRLASRSGARAPAIGNAVYNAVGIRIHDLPITPEKVLRALKQKRMGGRTPAATG